MVHICCIAAHDTSNGAGVTRDCIVANDFGIIAHPVITAITTQSFNSVESISPVSAEIIGTQLESVLKNFHVAAIKIGMLYHSEVIEIVSKIISKIHEVEIVIDPVMKSSGGQAILTDDGLDVLKEKLLPLASIITPNRYELEIIFGKNVFNSNDALNAAISIAKFYGCKVLLKGGHFDGTLLSDYLIGENSQVSVSHDRRQYIYSHGTGCVLSTALTCGLTLGLDDAKALEHAVNYTIRYFDSMNIAMVQ